MEDANAAQMISDRVIGLLLKDIASPPGSDLVLLIPGRGVVVAVILWLSHSETASDDGALAKVLPHAHARGSA